MRMVKGRRGSVKVFFGRWVLLDKNGGLIGTVFSVSFPLFTFSHVQDNIWSLFCGVNILQSVILTFLQVVIGFVEEFEKI